MPDVICLGELLIDFISTNQDVSLIDSAGFSKAPGGAPANVAAGISKLGFNAGFIGKIGDDPFGYYLKKVLDELHIDTKYLMIDRQYRTTLSFVALKADGLRDCMFYRNPGADMMLCEEEISQDYIANSKIFHFGSISLSCEPVKTATLKAIACARANNVIVSYDPNLRMGLWANEEEAKHEINDGFKLADIVKISEEEYGFITGCSSNEECAAYIIEQGAKFVVISLGKDGCFYSNGIDEGYISGYPVKTIETTGAGDAFVAALLAGLLGVIGKDTLFDVDAEMIEILHIANAAGALATTRIGAIPSLPTRDEVLRLAKYK